MGAKIPTPAKLRGELGELQSGVQKPPAATPGAGRSARPRPACQVAWHAGHCQPHLPWRALGVPLSGWIPAAEPGDSPGPTRHRPHSVRRRLLAAPKERPKVGLPLPHPARALSLPAGRCGLAKYILCVLRSSVRGAARAERGLYSQGVWRFFPETPASPPSWLFVVGFFKAEGHPQVGTLRFGAKGGSAPGVGTSPKPPWGREVGLQTF